MPYVSRYYCLPLFVDDFSESNGSWPIDDNANYRYEYLAGEYRILIKDTQWWVAGRPGTPVVDPVVAVDVRNANGVYGSYGIMVGLTDDWSQFYSVELDPTGEFTVFQYNDATGWDTLVEGPSAAIQQGTATNRLKVVYSQSQVTAYANGQFLTSVPASAPAGPRHFGLIASSYDWPNVDVRFDNLSVYPAACEPGISALGDPAFRSGAAIEPGMSGASHGHRPVTRVSLP
jgi:hypothetical protein